MRCWIVWLGSHSRCGITTDESWQSRRTFCSHVSNGCKQYSQACNSTLSAIHLVCWSTVVLYRVFIQFIPFELRWHERLLFEDQFALLVRSFGDDLSTLFEKKTHRSLSTPPPPIRIICMPSLDRMQWHNRFQSSVHWTPSKINTGLNSIRRAPFANIRSTWTPCHIAFIGIHICYNSSGDLQKKRKQRRMFRSRSVRDNHKAKRKAQSHVENIVRPTPVRAGRSE